MICLGWFTDVFDVVRPWLGQVTERSIFERMRGRFLYLRVGYYLMLKSWANWPIYSNLVYLIFLGLKSTIDFLLISLITILFVFLSLLIVAEAALLRLKNDFFSSVFKSLHLIDIWDFLSDLLDFWDTLELTRDLLDWYDLFRD
jgi:hypothetical protein